MDNSYSIGGAADIGISMELHVHRELCAGGHYSESYVCVREIKQFL